MSTEIRQRLLAIGITLPDANAPAGIYRPYVLQDRQVWLSGQTARVAGKVAYEGQVGGDLTLEQGCAAARICMTNLLSQLQNACDGNLGQVERCLKVVGFISAAPGFKQHSLVMDAASEVIVAAFGKDGIHARSAVGVSSLPSNSAVEIEAVFLLRK